MKIKHRKTAANLLVECGYADYVKHTSTQAGEIVAYWVCWFDEFENDEPDDKCELVTMKNGYAYKQVFALENYFAWNHRDLWAQSDRYTMRPVSIGQYCIQERRLDKIKYCIKETSNEKT